jgi:hypothetical protein
VTSPNILSVNTSYSSKLTAHFRSTKSADGRVATEAAWLNWKK